MLDMKRIEKVIDSIIRKSIAQDATQWITVHPGGKGPKTDGSGDRKGTPVLIDKDTGKILGGMGGKFTGEKISEIRKDFSGPKTPKGYKKPQKTRTRKNSGLPITSSSEFAKIDKRIAKAQQQSDIAHKEYMDASKEEERVRSTLWGKDQWVSFQMEDLKKRFPGCTISEGGPRTGYLIKVRSPDGYTGTVVNIGGTVDYFNTTAQIDTSLKTARKMRDEWDEGTFERKVLDVKIEHLENYRIQIAQYEAARAKKDEASQKIKDSDDELMYAQTAKTRLTSTYSGLSSIQGLSTHVDEDTIQYYDGLIITNAPDAVKRYIGARVSNATIVNAELEGDDAYAIGANISYNMNGRRSAHDFLHELGHAMDWDEQTQEHKSKTWRNGQFEKSLDADVKSIIAQRQRDITKLSSMEYAEKYGLPHAFVKTYMGYSGSVTEKIKNLLHYELKNLKCDGETSLNIADMILMSTRGVFGYGHEKSYAMKKERHQATEAFAEITQQYCQFPKEMDIIRKFFPRAAKDYDRMIQEV